MASQSVEYDKFAACMRTLKERSGLSYGALARQAGISRSSLHRYCSGSYVPQDYGYAHQFATACGASPEELRRLHRLWAQADARRETGHDTDTDPVQDVDGSSGDQETAPLTDAAPTPHLPRHRRRQLVLGALVLVLALGTVAWGVTATSNSNSADSAGPVLVRAHGDQTAAPTQDTSWTPAFADAHCPGQGLRFKTRTNERVYLVGPGSRLYYIPNPTVYFKLWDSWNEITPFPDNVFADCNWPRAYELTDAVLAKMDNSALLYIWDAWYGYRITSEAAVTQYGFSRAKIQTRSSLSPISSNDWR